MFGLFKRDKPKAKTLSDVKVNLTRDDLLRRGRVLIIDDEPPELMTDLKNARFSVDHVTDITGNNLNLIENPGDDLIVLDFGNVGSAFGDEEGLALLRHIKRVNPSSVVYAYTSKALEIKHADFYRLADGVLKKDAGITESTEKIEEGLRKALSLQNLWNGVLSIAQIKPGSKEDLELQTSFTDSVEKPENAQAFRTKFLQFVNNETAQKIGGTLIEKLIELAAKSLLE